MKIVHITETMTSGVLKYIQEVVHAVDWKKAEHTIVFSVRDQTPEDVKSLFPERVRLIRVDLGLSGRPLSIVRTLRGILRSEQPDIVHLHSTIAGVWGRLGIAAGFPQVQVLYTPHGYSFLMSHKPLLLRLAYWICEFVLSQVCGRIVACSRSEYLHARRLSPFRGSVLVENAIRPCPVPFAGASSPPLVIGAGRMAEQKNPRLFVEIAAHVRQADANVQFVWVGDGSLRKECEELNRRSGAGVRFTGWLSNGETVSWLSRAAVFLQTSRWEGLPYSVLESLAAGVPVVASDIRSHRDLFPDTYRGYLARNIEEYADYIRKLLNDPRLARQMIESNWEAVERNYGLFAGKLEKLYTR